MKSIFVLKQVTLYKFTKINTSSFKTSKTYIFHKNQYFLYKTSKTLFL